MQSRTKFPRCVETSDGEGERLVDNLTIEDARNLIMGADDAPMVSVDVETASCEAADEATVETTRSFDEESVGLGVDIVEIERMRTILDRTPSFAERVFSPEECAYCLAKSNPAAHFALRFAAKEAVVKALGTGFSDGINVRDIEVVRTKGGKPVAKLSGRAFEIAQEQGVRDLPISLSYTHSDAVACAMAVTEASARAVEKRKDPTEELARQFKEVRGMLDEL